MNNFDIALKYLSKNKVTAHELAKHSGLSRGSLYKVLNGTTENPSRKTKDAVIEYAKYLTERNSEVFGGNAPFDIDLGLLDEKDPYYIKKLALAVRKNKEKLLEEQSFKDLVYIEALKMALLAKVGDSISTQKLMELNK